MTTSTLLDPDTAGTIQAAIAAARKGDLDGACQLAEAGLAEGGDPVALNAFLGMMFARAGAPDRAVSHLREAHVRRPEDVTIACNLIAALIDAGELASALDVARHDLAMSDPTQRIARYRGFLAQSLERFQEAAESYEAVVAAIPSDFESWNNLGNARRALGDVAGSVAALERANALNASAPCRFNLASALAAAGRGAEAEEALKALGADYPDDPQPLVELYRLYKSEGRNDEAVAAIGQAADRAPLDANLRLMLGVELGEALRVDEAEAAFRKAIAADPRIADAYLGLAVNYEHTNRQEDFAALARLAEQNGLDEAVIAFIRALELRRAGRFEEALAALARVPESIEPERSAHIRGTLLDRMGCIDEAFAAFAEANRIHAQHASAPLARAAELRRQLRDDIERLTPEWLASWTPAPAPSRGPLPAFLLGFPRSGTTLLDTILMGHPHVQVMEEQPILRRVSHELGELQGLAALDEAGIVAARELYFKEAAAHCDVARPGLIVDKSPLHLNKVALIHRLFPGAPIILALRHPCDVLLSCFMSNFRLNAAMSNFLRLSDAAEFYDLTFRYWEQARSMMPLNVHTIVYERMVEDTAGELRPLFDFLGLDWRPEALDHERTAASRGLITTASYSQVREPIYKRAAGRWLRYRGHLEPILPILEPWVERFGYAL
jgi:tetratricopeptide (TPR) repeat protein